MRLASINSRLALAGVRGAIDVEAASAGRFSPDPQAIYEQWAQFSAWYAANSETIRTAEATPTARTHWAHRFRNRVRCSPSA